MKLETLGNIVVSNGSIHDKRREVKATRGKNVSKTIDKPRSANNGISKKQRITPEEKLAAKRKQSQRKTNIVAFRPNDPDVCQPPDLSEETKAVAPTTPNERNSKRPKKGDRTYY